MTDDEKPGIGTEARARAVEAIYGAAPNILSYEEAELILDALIALDWGPGDTEEPMRDNRQNVHKFMLRLPEGWRDHIKAEAERNRRSMHQEILIALGKAFGLSGEGGADG